jgi:uncharacterized protein
MCGKALVLEHEGTLYACDHFVYDEYKVGNIMETPLEELVNSGSQRKFGEDKRNRLPSQCRECAFLPLCAGGCPKNRFITDKNGDRELNFLCEGYYSFFEYTAPYMQRMVQLLRSNRAPADIMEEIRAHDLKTAKPNDPCPCGSGLKFKSCCARKKSKE